MVVPIFQFGRGGTTPTAIGHTELRCFTADTTGTTTTTEREQAASATMNDIARMVLLVLVIRWCRCWSNSDPTFCGGPDTGMTMQWLRCGGCIRRIIIITVVVVVVVIVQCIQ